jgi:hypothetical protein
MKELRNGKATRFAQAFDEITKIIGKSLVAQMKSQECSKNAHGNK